MPDPENKTPSWAEVALRIGVHVLQNRPSRRRLMFYVTLATLAQLAVGVFFMEALVRSIFGIVYWLFCLLMVGFMLLLSFYDMLRVRQEEQLRRKVEELRLLAEASKELKQDGDDSGDAGKA